ncbi:MAG: hypothetical protein AAF585_01630 [Verrucomicrobiota bacterium]
MKINHALLLLSAGILAFTPFVSTAGEHSGAKNPKMVIEPESKFPDENLWIYTKGTAAREKGDWELKLREIARIGKGEGSYVFHDFRPEIEYGITDSFTIGASAWIWHHDYRGIPWGPMNEVNPTPSAEFGEVGNYTGTQIGGWEVFFKWEIWDPEEKPLGIAIGGAFDHRTTYRLDGQRISQDTVTPMIFLQKSMMDDRLQWAFTGKLEIEQRKGGGILEEEIAPDLSTGLSYNIAEGLWVGIEARWQSDFLVPFNEETGEYEPFGEHADGGFSPSNYDLGHFTLGDQFQWGLYVGPTIHWDPTNTEWWITAGALWQVKGWSADGADASSRGRNWDEHEAAHIGLIFGYEWGND